MAAVAETTREFRAEARFQRVSPQKARLVLDLIKGRGVEEALTVAQFTKKRIAPVIHKLRISAVDNAKYLAGERGLDLDVDNLYVKQALANEGPRMKRIRPAPMGRAYRYQRRLTHIILTGAERHAASGLVTRVEEPSAAPHLAKAVKAKKAAPAASKAKHAAPKAQKKKATETGETKHAAKAAANKKK